jgi:hypothetical protein
MSVHHLLECVKLCRAVDTVGLGGGELLLEDGLHLLAHSNGLCRLSVLNILPAKSLVLLDTTLEHPTVGQADRQARDGHGVGGWHQAAVDGVAALAVELFADLEIPLGRRDYVARPSLGLACGLAADHDGRDGHAELEAYQVVRLELRRVPAAGVRLQAVLLEAFLLVLSGSWWEKLAKQKR